MELRQYEGKAHAAGYLKYRVAPHEVISRIISDIEKKVRFQHFNQLQYAYTCFGVIWENRWGEKFCQCDHC